MSIMSRGRAAMPVLLAAVLLAGCAASAETGAPPSRPAQGTPLVVTPPSVSAVPRLESVRGLALPTDAFRPTAQESRQGLSSVIPPDTLLNRVEVDGETATVDLTEEFLEVQGQGPVAAFAQVVWTKGFPNSRSPLARSST